MANIELSEEAVYDLSDIDASTRDGVRVEISPDTLKRLDAAYALFSSRQISTPTYGLNTGLGPMVSVAVDRENLSTQQRNLIRSHASGFGDPLTLRQSKAVLFARACSLTRNRSSVNGSLPLMMARLLSAGVGPYIPRHGGVGASGDLVQLAHLGLFLMGEGKGVSTDGTSPAAEILETSGCAPLTPSFRDGLALINGVSAMTGVGLLAVLDAKKLLDVAFHVSAALAQIVGAGEDPYSEALSSVKASGAQRAAAARLRHLFSDGTALTRHEKHGAGTKRPLQEHYSVRCTPQILGAASTLIELAEQTLVDELNSVSDNPAFFPETESIVHGGNFHGEPVAMAMDSLKIAVVKLTMLLERQLNFLVHDGINGLLPAFLNDRTPGVDFGFQGAQFTATSTTAHSQSLSFPMSVHSITCNRDNQDIVSMGFDAACMATETVANGAGVSAMTAMAAAEATRILGIDDILSPETNEFLGQVREEAHAAGTGAAVFTDALEKVQKDLYPGVFQTR